jgi:hypothetical protein
MMLNLNKKKQQVYKKLAAQDRKQLKVESSLRFLLKSLFFDTVPKKRCRPRRGGYVFLACVMCLIIFILSASYFICWKKVDFLFRNVNQ